MKSILSSGLSFHRAENTRADDETASDGDAATDASDTGTPAPAAQCPNASDSLMIKRALDAISNGSLDPMATEHQARSLLTEGNLAAAVYDALASRAWSLIRSPETGEEMTAWHEVFRSVSVLLKRRGTTDLADRLRGVGDLVAQTARFSARRPLKSVMSRRHAPEILALIDGADGGITRYEIVRQTGLNDANLSRILRVMQDSGLVQRRTNGREACFVITHRGRATCAEYSADSGAKRLEQPAEMAVSDDYVKAFRLIHARLGALVVELDATPQKGTVPVSARGGAQQRVRRERQLSRPDAGAEADLPMLPRLGYLSDPSVSAPVWEALTTADMSMQLVRGILEPSVLGTPATPYRLEPADVPQRNDMMKIVRVVRENASSVEAMMNNSARGHAVPGG